MKRLLRAALLAAVSVSTSSRLAYAQARASSATKAVATPVKTPVRTLRYRVDTKTQQLVDARVPRGEPEQSLIDRSVFLTIMLADSVRGTRLRASVDSIVDRSQRPSPPTLDSTRGRVFSGLLASDGNVVRLDYPAGIGAPGLVVGALLEDFFPRVKPGFRSGDDWTTRSERPHRIPNGLLTVARRTAYAVMGTTVHEGRPSSRLDMTFTTNASGTQRVGTSRATVQGESMGSESAFIATDGTYLGGMRTEKVERRLKLLGTKATVVVTAETITTITLLK